jgi:hypothetical protein
MLSYKPLSMPHDPLHGLFTADKTKRRAPEDDNDLNNKNALEEHIDVISLFVFIFLNFSKRYYILTISYQLLRLLCFLFIFVHVLVPSGTL